LLLLPVRFGVVFGSRTTGKADAWSDIDLVVVSPQFDAALTRQGINLLWRPARGCHRLVQAQ
jgi:predicted nucleotidyltransferase